MSPLALADVHLDLLYERDEGGLLLRSRDSTVAAPLLHLLRTTEGNRWLLSAALSEAEQAHLQKALAAEPVVSDLSEFESRPPLLTGVRALLERERAMNAAADLDEERGPAFSFPDAMPLSATATQLLSDPRGAHTVAELAWIRSATAAEQPLCVARNAAGEVAAVCHSARSTAGAAEAGVETAPAYRGRGLAGAVVAGWAAAVRAEGGVPIYSTQWTNHASRAVARKLGLILFGEDYHIGRPARHG